MSSRLVQRRMSDHKAETASPSHELVHFLLLPSGEPSEQGLSGPPPAELKGLPDHFHFCTLCTHRHAHPSRQTEEPRSRSVIHRTYILSCSAVSDFL